MIRRNLTNLSFQTFYVSHEQSHCPLVSDMIRLGKNFGETSLPEDTTGVISLGYGKRIIINGNNIDLENLKIEDVLEIVDYDPVKKIVLAMGPTEPNVDTPVHWLIHHARDDVNAVIQLNGEKLVEKFSKKLPTTEKEYTSGTLELAKEILRTLRTSNSKNILLKDKGILFVGASVKEVEDIVIKICEEV